MDYVEEHVWVLTSDTSCYSGARLLRQNEDNRIIYSARMATARHACCIRTSEGCDSSLPPFLEEAIVPNDRAALSCVGYSAFGDWECLAFVDAAKISSLSMPLANQPMHSAQSLRDVPARELDDGSTVASTTNTNYNEHHRRTSSFTISESSAPAAHGSFSQAPNFGGMESFSHQQGIPSAMVTGIGQLRLRKIPTSRDEATSAIENMISLDFRPLASKVCEFKEHDGTKSRGIWCGSADNAKLHWYVPCDPNSLDIADLEELNYEAFHFNSPVMAIEFLTTELKEKPVSCLAVACQDGTVRLITFQYKLGTFAAVRSTQVLVDGPIVCLHLEEQPQCVRVLVGSLCGYAAEIQLDTDRFEYKGPFMVTEGLWNPTSTIEDSALAVCSEGDNILVGTFSGRCLLFRRVTGVPDNDAAPIQFDLVWQCYLPYPIHSLGFLPGRRILVTTRRGLHIFRLLESVDYAGLAERAKRRLEALLEAKCYSL